MLRVKAFEWSKAADPSGDGTAIDGPATT